MRPRLLLAAASLIGLLGASPCAAQARPDAPLDLRTLFTTGPLSPGFPAKHRGSSGAPLGVIEPGERRPIFGVLFNPALFAFGRWSASAELAFLPVLSVFVEGSRILNFKVAKLPDDHDKISGYLVDVGLHLWLFGEGLRGVYLGPRTFFGSGSETDGLADGKLSGWGADLGYQWVAGVFSVNVGAGLGSAKVVVTPTDDAVQRAKLPEGLQQEVTRTFLIPLVTVGIGAAF